MDALLRFLSFMLATFRRPAASGAPGAEAAQPAQQQQQQYKDATAAATAAGAQAYDCQLEAARAELRAARFRNTRLAWQLGETRRQYEVRLGELAALTSSASVAGQGQGQQQAAGDGGGAGGAGTALAKLPASRRDDAAALVEYDTPAALASAVAGLEGIAAAADLQVRPVRRVGAGAHAQTSVRAREAIHIGSCCTSLHACCLGRLAVAGCQAWGAWRHKHSAPMHTLRQSLGRSLGHA